MRDLRGEAGDELRAVQIPAARGIVEDRLSGEPGLDRGLQPIPQNGTEQAGSQRQLVILVLESAGPVPAECHRLRRRRDIAGIVEIHRPEQRHEALLRRPIRLLFVADRVDRRSVGLVSLAESVSAKLGERKILAAERRHARQFERRCFARHAQPVIACLVNVRGESQLLVGDVEFGLDGANARAVARLQHVLRVSEGSIPRIADRHGLQYLSQLIDGQIERMRDAWVGGILPPEIELVVIGHRLAFGHAKHRMALTALRLDPANVAIVELGTEQPDGLFPPVLERLRIQFVAFLPQHHPFAGARRLAPLVSGEIGLREVRFG